MVGPLQRGGVAAWAMGLAATLWTAGLHPLHTTLTEVVQTNGSATITVTIRAFTDDLKSAVVHSERRASIAPDDSLTARYVRARVIMLDDRREPVALVWLGRRETADVTWLTLEARLPRGLSGSYLLNAMHTELYRDQVNIVQVRFGTRTESLLFTPGDSAKALR